MSSAIESGLVGDGESARSGILPTAQHVLTLAGHTGKVFSSVFSPDGTVLASGGGLFLWRAPA